MEDFTMPTAKEILESARTLKMSAGVIQKWLAGYLALLSTLVTAGVIPWARAVHESVHSTAVDVAVIRQRTEGLEREHREFRVEVEHNQRDLRSEVAREFSRLEQRVLRIEQE